MNTSLTVLLPVHNAQARLADQVERLLDVLPEMSRNFEVVIIDDGSTDETPDIGYELATFFPQVNLVRHPVRLGLEESIQTGLDVSTGEVVFVGDEQYGIEIDDLEKLWQVHEDKDLIVARRNPNGKPAPTGGKKSDKSDNWIGNLVARSQKRQAAAAAVPQPAVQMLRRDNLNNMPTIGSLTLGRRIDNTPAKKPIVPGPISGKPNYLDKFKRSTLGE